MSDFDFICSRKSPSVVASTYPFTGDHKQKFYFGKYFKYIICRTIFKIKASKTNDFLGQKEIFIPAYKSMEKAFTLHPDATVLASLLFLFNSLSLQKSLMSPIKNVLGHLCVAALSFRNCYGSTAISTIARK